MRSLLAVIFFAALVESHMAQSEFSVLASEDVMQTDTYNPARFHRPGWHFALPNGLYNHFHTGPGFNGFIDNNDKTTVLKVSALKEGLEVENFLYSDLRLQTIKVKYGNEHWSFGFDHEIIYHNTISYPGDLVRLYVEGNQQFIGQSIDVGPTGQIYSMNSYGFLISHKSSKVTIGIKPRLLFGRFFGNTPLSSATLTTSDDVYQVTLNTDYRFDNVGLLQFAESNFLNYQLQALDRWSLTGKNVGLAMDIGSQIHFSEVFDLSFSVIDWGSIHWQDNIKSYISRRLTTYEGVEVEDLFNKQSISITGSLDSLKSIFDLVEEQNSLKFNLPVKWFAVANYQITPKVEMALITYYQNRLHQPLVLGLQATARLLPEWKFGTNLSNRYGVINWGFSATWIRPYWIGYFAMDQLLAGLNPVNASQFNARLGVNIHLKKTSFD